MTEIKPCPWCGADTVRATQPEESLTHRVQVWCCACGACGPKKAKEAEAIAAWNTIPRPEPWVDKPDESSRFWWYWEPDWSRHDVVPSEVVFGVFENTAYFPGGEMNLSNLDGKWQRARIPEPPEVE